MWRQLAPLSLVVSALFAAPALNAQWTLDPEPDFEEFRAQAAVQPDGGVLLTWSRQLEPGADWTVMAATLDPGSGRIGEPHEWGEGGNEQPVSLGAGDVGYLALRQDFNDSFNWVVERLDPSGRVAGTPRSLGYGFAVAAYPVPGAGAVIVLSGASQNGAAQAWKLGPDGALLAGPVTLVEPSFWVAAGADAAGNLVLAWTDQGARVWKVYENSNVPTLRARFLSLVGRPEGKAVRLAQIRGFLRGDLLRPRTESLPTGDFLILWTRMETTGQNLTLQGRRFP